MRLTTKKKYDSLEEALKRPEDCRTLNLVFVKENLGHLGQSFLKLQNLQELFIQGDIKVFDDRSFKLPEELGQLHKIEKLTLLNLPLVDFPNWILQFNRLKYLMIRGTDIQNIPTSINRLKELTTLRIENCPLTTLPTDLKELHKLKNLGLSDTKLTAIDKKFLPTSLRKINLAGTQLFNAEIGITDSLLKFGNI